MAKGNLDLAECKKCGGLFWIHLQENMESGLCTSCLVKKNKKEKKKNGRTTRTNSSR